MRVAKVGRLPPAFIAHGVDNELGRGLRARRVSSQSTTEWVFSPRIGSAKELETDGAAARPNALRAGHAMGVAFELRWSSGPGAEVVLRGGDPASRQWISRLLSPAFELGQWRPRTVDVEDALGVGAPRYGVSTGGILLLGGGERGSWTDAAVAALPTFPPGLRTRWRSRPAGTPILIGEQSPELEGRRQPPGFRLQNLTGPEREARDLDAEARLAPTWATELVVDVTDPRIRVTDTDRWCSVVALASARGSRGRVRFRRPFPLLALPPPIFLLSEPEILGVLPSPSTWYVSEPRSPAAGGRPIAFGRDSAGNLAELPVAPGQGRHAIVLGETGMGKSSVLIRLARSSLGSGNVVLFDPVGDTGRAFLASLPARHVANVVWISPHSSPVALDLLAALRSSGRTPASADRCVSDLVSALRRIRAGRFTETAFWGPRIEETVRATLRAAALLPGATLADLPRLLTTASRRPVGVPDEALEAFEELAARVRERPEEVDGSRRLLAELVDRAVLRSMLGDPTARFRVAEMFAPGRITVLTGDAAIVGEDAARYLLAVYLALFWSERLASPDASKTFLILDEVQWYAHDSVAEMLRLGRRANLHVWMATQSLDSLPEAVRMAVQTNVADFLVFRGSPTDARDLGRMLPRLRPEAFWSQPPGHAIALLGKGERVLVVRTDPPVERAPDDRDSRFEAVRDAASRFLPRSAIETAAVPASIGATTTETGLRPGLVPVLRTMILAIWSEILDSENGVAVRILLDELRAIFDPPGEEVRSLGRRLREEGVLLRSDRDEQGTYWEVGRAGFERLLGPGVDPRELDDASRRWRGRGSAASRP